MAEFGPALTVLFLSLFFPLVDLLALEANYASCLVLNNCQLREAAFSSKQDAPETVSNVEKLWQREGLGQFVKVVDTPTASISYIDAGTPALDGVGRDQYVQVTTFVKASPFLRIPLFPGVPGLGSPVTFQVSSERLLENTVKS